MTSRRRLSALLVPCAALFFFGAREAAAPAEESARDVLRRTWAAYVRKFIQADGRVIDWKAGAISTSEGQAYALLRAVWMDDRATFDRVLSWGVNNLNGGVRSDSLWAWKWGRAPDGTYRVLDAAFATDGDQDVALALFMAARTWQAPSYREQARTRLGDLWEKGTRLVNGRRLLLAGDSLCTATTCRLNPSYCAPYAYRVFAREDAGHDWKSLVDGCYEVLAKNSALTATKLPSDWVILDQKSGELRPGDEKDAQYSYGALRVPWRIALDGLLNREPRAQAYLRHSLAWAAAHFRREKRLPGAIAASGEPRAPYEAPEMLAALAPALRESAPDVAEAMSTRLRASLGDDGWGDRESYYLQNWAWFGWALDRREVAPFERVARP